MNAMVVLSLDNFLIYIWRLMIFSNSWIAQPKAAVAAVVGKIFLSDSGGDDAAATWVAANSALLSKRSLPLSLARSVGRTFGRKFIPDSRYQLLIRAALRASSEAITVCGGSDRARRGRQEGPCMKLAGEGERLVTGLQPWFCLSLPLRWTESYIIFTFNPY